MNNKKFELPRLDNYEWFDFYADAYNEGRITLAALGNLYLSRTRAVPKQAEAEQASEQRLNGLA